MTQTPNTESNSLWSLIFKPSLVIIISVIMVILLINQFSGIVADANRLIVTPIFLIIILLNFFYAKNIIKFIKSWFGGGPDYFGFGDLFLYLITFPLVFIYVFIKQLVLLLSNIKHLIKSKRD